MILTASDQNGNGLPHHDPLAALREKDFRFYAGSRFFASMAQALQQAAIYWQVYAISHSALQLGLVGLARFAPSLGLSLVGGALADIHDRRRIVLAAQIVPFASSLMLFLATRSGHLHLSLIYVLVLLMAVSSAFENPARQAMLPSVVSRRAFAKAVAMGSTLFQLGTVSGPALGGLMIAVDGVASAYALDVVLIAAAAAMLLPVRLRVESGRTHRRVSLTAIREGIDFVRHRQVVLGAMTLDMFAVIFGGATALLPVYARDVLHVGAGGYGLLQASQPVGALVTSSLLVLMRPVERVGRALLVSVAVFGAMTVLFGISRWFPLSLLAYALTGCADEVSVNMRSMTIQLATPDELRGRVSSVSSIFIGASNQVGAMESGFVAALTSATIAVVSGGLGSIAVVGVVAARMPELRHYRIDHSGRATTQEVGEGGRPAAVISSATPPALP
jgi:MFS family permease